MDSDRGVYDRTRHVIELHSPPPLRKKSSSGDLLEIVADHVRKLRLATFCSRGSEGRKGPASTGAPPLSSHAARSLLRAARGVSVESPPRAPRLRVISSCSRFSPTNGYFR